MRWIMNLNINGHNIFVIVLVVVVGNTIYTNRRAKAVVSHRKKGGF